jgi:hypothetical protein
VKSTSKDLKREVGGWMGAAWNVLSTKLAGDNDGASGGGGGGGAPDAALDRVTSPPPLNVVCGKVNAGGRVDFQLQEDAVDIVRENMMNMKAHSSYWSSRDAAMFIIERCYKIAA